RERVADQLADAQLALRLRLACGMGSGTLHVGSAALMRRYAYDRAAASERPPDLLDAVALDDVAGAHVLVFLEGHAALLTGRHLAYLVLEALQRRQLPVVDDDVVADEPHVGAALHHALGDTATGHLADLGDIEDLQDLRVAQHGLAAFRRQEARHRRFHVIHQVVDDVVVADLDS